ncbi:hypothetical protein RhiirA4_483523 [Rhizophagus irregularis]|uniref:Uncharacterized protein n=1 Tax=Rhizophagus irregularis TaxID=588596 RepID=A0A2I1HMN1_9GLOM|nr:hypothetical protein RhiirA4_483523 [Rhizophagus irregularis]
MKKRRSKYKSVRFKKILVHLIPLNNDSPNLVLYKGCDKNIKLKKDKNECWIYIQNEKDSRKIEYGKEIFNEAKYIGPYETLVNTFLKMKQRIRIIKLT